MPDPTRFTPAMPHAPGPVQRDTPAPAQKATDPQPPILPPGDTRFQLMTTRTPLDFWRAVDGIPDAPGPFAPPSILQMRIAQLLARPDAADSPAVHASGPHAKPDWPREVVAPPPQPPETPA